MERPHPTGCCASAQAPRAPSAERRIERLGKTLALLSSAHDGERLAAAAAANRQLADFGLDWPTLVERAFREPAPPAPRSRPSAPPAFDAQGQVQWLLARRHALTPWECSFAQSLLAQPYPPTVRQTAKLLELLGRVSIRCGEVGE